MKHTPRKVYILENNQYVEITYEELCRTEESNSRYQDKRFLLLHGVLMEVTKDVYDDFYRTKRRQQYLLTKAIANGDLSYDILDTDEFRGSDILVDPDENIAEQIADKMMIEKLRRVLLLLPKDEEQLIREHYFEGISQVRLGELYGVNQSSINRKIKKILMKIKKLLEI